MTRIDGEQIVEQMVRLAREELSGEVRDGGLRSLAELEWRLEHERTPWWSRRWVWAGALVPVAALVLVIGLWLANASDPITYAVVNGIEQGGSVVGGQATQLRFSEGSEVTLERGAVTAVSELAARGGTLHMRRGRARVAIVHKPRAEWKVIAGPYAVQVTGTEFDVAWSDSERTLEVAMRSGSVIVSGPALRLPVQLTAGQRLLQRESGETRIETMRSPSDRAGAARLTAGSARHAAAAGAADTSGTATPDGLNAGVAAGSRPTSPTAVQGTAESGRAASAAEGSWARKVAQGKFADVLADAERQGLDGVIAKASPAELAALGDAARYARRTALAERVLLAQRERFAGTASARGAAFLLGQLAESQGRGGLDWYERYLNESPNGPYASQALGRKMMISYQQGGAASARGIASEYLVRYPKGPYVAAARKITSELSSRPSP